MWFLLIFWIGGWSVAECPHARGPMGFPVHSAQQTVRETCSGSDSAQRSERCERSKQRAILSTSGAVRSGLTCCLQAAMDWKPH